MNKQFRLVWFILIAGIVMGLGHWQSAAAATLTVTNPGDGGANAANCPGATTCRLRDAILKAASGDTVIFSVTGTITLTAGRLDITKNLIIQGPGATLLKISGNNTSRVFKIIGGISVILKGMTIANGFAVDNYVYPRGGAIENSGYLTIQESTFSANVASSGEGGAIFNSGSLAISNSIFSGNVGNAFGGGISNTGTLVLTNSTLTGNSVTVRAGNGSNGGGIYNSGTATLTNCMLNGNSSDSGGGIDGYLGTLTLINSTLSGNLAKSAGGGIRQNQGTVTLINSTITRNSVDKTGTNYAPIGGGITNYGGILNARNTIIAQNTVLGINNGLDVYGALISLGYNLIGDARGATISGDATGNLLNVNPLLAPLGNYGGGTLTHALLPGSLAINAGNNCVLTNTCASNNLGTNLTTDQRLFGRQVGSAVDIGAFESRGFTLAIAGGNNQSAMTGVAFATPLAVTVTASDSREPISGGQVTFTAPVSGASCAVAGNPATIIGNKATTGTVLANANSGGPYTVAASAKGAATAVNFSLTNICAAPSITAQPASQSVCLGATAKFNVTATGIGLTYQWRKNGVNIAGATSSNYTTPVTTATDNGALYSVVVKMACGLTVTSVNATLTVKPATAISTQPQAQAVCVGKSATFNVTATGTGLTYQWRKKGVNIAGATSSSYTTPAATSADNGALYSVVVTGACGTVTSSSAKLIIGTVITTQPQNKTVCLGSTVFFQVIATGPGLTYQWRRNGVNITGATSYNYTTPATTAADEGALYSVVVRDACGTSVTSASAKLTFLSSLVEVSSTADGNNTGTLRTAIATACPGSTIKFTPNMGNLITLTSGQITINKNLTIQGPGEGLLTISGNSASRVFQINNGASVTLRYLTITDGDVVSDIYNSGQGGGIYNKGTLTVENCTLSDNSAGSGGGISNEGSLSLINSTLSDNSAFSIGGGIENRPGGVLTIKNSLLARNSARTGGGASILDSSAAITNSTLSGNSGITQGGGINYLSNVSGSSLRLTNCTITGNSVGSATNSKGGGIFQAGVIYSRNSIIAGNIKGSTLPNEIFRASGSFTSLGYNLIAHNLDASIVPTTGDQFGTGATAINPLLAPLGDYGGVIKTHALLPGSPALNAGGNCVLTNSCPSNNLGFNLTTDQRGGNFARQVGSAVDIGAFESKGFTLAIVSGNNQSAVVTKVFAAPLVVKVTAVGGGKVAGGTVTFTPPASGASAVIAGTPATINASGVATTGTVTANATPGAYSVAVSAKGAATSINFSLTNTAALLATQDSTLLTSTDTPEVDRQHSSKAKVVGDYDGDGKSDLAIWRSEEGRWQILYSSTGETHTAKLSDFSSPEDVPVSGDFDGDGKADIAVFRRGDAEAGHWLIQRSSDDEIVDVLFGLGGDVPVAADYDGDGKTDIAVWRGSEGRWYIAQSSDNQMEVVSLGSNAASDKDMPVPADYDGDGKTDFAVFLPGSEPGGHWYLRRSSDGAMIDKPFGLPNDLPVAADYDGDGKADIAVWRSAEGAWLVLRSSDGRTETMSLGKSRLGEWAVMGDYDGDGRADVALWRASEGTWQIKSSADGSTITKMHGQSGDRPVNARQP